MQINLRQIVLTISRAVDLVGIDDVFHARRVAMLAVECAKVMKWDEATRETLFDAALLHDCGVSSTRDHRSIVDHIDWIDAEIHCRKGYALLRDFSPLAHLAPVVRYHHTHWRDLEHLMPRQPDLPPIDDRAKSLANLIYLTDRVDALASKYYADDSLLMHTDEIRAAIAARRAEFFAPELVDAFMQASDREAFWLLLDRVYVPQYVAEMEQATESRQATLADLKQFALLIAAIVDAKSHFTAEHSLGVARIGRYLGELCGIAGDRLEMLEIAALMHDIGKLRVPDELLESPAQYTAADRAVMKKHSFATYQILRQVGGFEDLALWAAEHHESLNGNGYPFHLRGTDIPLEARIVKVADVFQALAQRRPYREPMPAQDILGLLRRMQTAGEVDARLVDIVAAHLQHCEQLANRIEATAA